MITDISERKRVEKALRESEQSFRALGETAPLGVGVSSAEGKIIYTNRAYEAILGYERGGLLGQPSTTVYYDPVDRQAWLAAMKEKGKITDYEVRFRHKDGSPVWISINVAPIEFSGGPAIIGVIQDISERKRAEEEREKLLAEVSNERERLATIINSIDDEVWISDAAGRLVQLNPTAQKVHGLKANGKPISSVVDSLEILEPDGTPRLRENTPMLRALKGEIVSGEEYIRSLNTGELRYRRYSCAPIRDHLGNITGTVAVVKDITERKRHEQQQEFLLKLSDAIRPLSSAQSIKDAATQLLVNHLRASQ